MMQLQQFGNTDALNADFAARLVDILQQAIEQRGAAYLVVSGGKTPQALFNTLSNTDLAWDKVTVLLADDRWLDVSQADSNERLVKATLLQNKASNARFISLYADTASAFTGAAEVLPRISALPTFDAVILDRIASLHRVIELAGFRRDAQPRDRVAATAAEFLRGFPVPRGTVAR